MPLPRAWTYCNEMSDLESMDKHWLTGWSLIGFPITDIELDKERNVLLIEIAGVRTFAISDEGQSCCESRYITCDDDPKSIIGGVLQRIDVSESQDIRKKDAWNDHEAIFVRIETDKGFITITTHNEHNGYYGGFSLKLTEIVRDTQESNDVHQD